MKHFLCPNCGSKFMLKSLACPSCGEDIGERAWQEVECELPPMPENPTTISLLGDKGTPFTFRCQPLKMGVGQPSLARITSQSKCAGREQFVLSWEGSRCFISPPATSPVNATFVDGVRLNGVQELRHGQTIDLRGKSGRTAMPLVVIYS